MGKASSIKNLWNIVDKAKAAKDAGVVQMGKQVFKPLVKPAIIGGAAGYGGYQYLDNKNQSDLQNTTDETGIAVHTGPDGKPDFKSIFEYIKDHPEEARLKGIQAGPTNNGDAYGDFLNVQRSIQGKNAPQPFTGSDQPDPTKKGAGFSIPSGPRVLPSKPGPERIFDFREPEKVDLYDTNQLEALKAIPQLDASGMDESLAKLRERYAGREQAKESQIKAIQDQPYQVDLSPVMDLWKSWYGADFGSYKRPESNDERMARVFSMRDSADKENAAREEALYNMADRISGRKLTASQFNQEQPIAAAERMGKARHDQTAMDRDVDKTHNDNVSQIEQLRRMAEALDETKRANLTNEGISSYNAQTSRATAEAAAADRQAKLNTAHPSFKDDAFFKSLISKSTVEQLKRATGGDPAAMSVIAAEAAGYAQNAREQGDTSPPSMLANAAIVEAIKRHPAKTGPK